MCDLVGAEAEDEGDPACGVEFGGEFGWDLGERDGGEEEEDV